MMVPSERGGLPSRLTAGAPPRGGAAMGEYKQTNRKLKVITPLGPDDLLLKGYTIVEGISQLFSVRVEMIAENKTKVAFDKLIGQKLTVQSLKADESTFHSFNGLCVKFAQGEKDFNFTTYFAELVPDFWKLTRKAQSRIFQRMTVPEILKKVAKGLNVSWQIQGQFEPRDYCVQYRETDFNFASRLMEEEGIFYFFKHTEGDHEMVVANTVDAHPDVPGDTSLIYEEVEGGVRDEDRIWGWQKEQSWRSGKVLLWDHCFELPHKHLEADEDIQASAQLGKETHKLKVGGNDAFELYDWPGEYAQRFDGVDKSGGEQKGELQKIFRDNERTARIRMEEEAAPSLSVRGQSNVKHLVSGHKFTLKRHFNGDGPYVLTAATHVASFGADYRAEKDVLLRFENSFTAIPKALPYRPARVTPKPVVPGCQTAVVVGPSGEEIFTDKYGRVKVQFHWDREGKHDEDSSCWLRVAQLIAGRRWGASFWPRIGQEVLVDFLEGDPDQPVIVGVLYNADQMPPYLGDGPDGKHKNDNKLMGVKSNTTTGGVGFNEWRFDDTKGKEQVFIHAEKNMDVRVKSSSMESVGAAKHVTVGGEKDGQKSGEYRERTFKDKHVAVDNVLQAKAGDAKLLAGGGDGSGNLDLYVEGYWKTTVDGAVDVHLKDNRSTKVDGSDFLTVLSGVMVGVEGAIEASATEDVKVKSNQKIVLDGSQEVCLKGPGGFVKIDASGVTIVGNLVNINSGGSPSTAATVVIPDPEDAAKAEPTAPAAADNAKTGQKSC